MDVINFLDKSYTAYHAVKHSEYILEKHGFEKLDLAKKWKLEVGGKYYLVKNGTSVIAFVVGENFAFHMLQATPIRLVCISKAKRSFPLPRVRASTSKRTADLSSIQCSTHL